MSHLICKGSIALGSACRACARCFTELETLERQKRDQLQARLDWMQEVNTLHRSFETLYVVDGYQVVITWDGDPISPCFHAESLEGAIEKARTGFDLNARHPYTGEDYDPEPSQIAGLALALRDLFLVSSELCTAVDNQAEDIGGSRPTAEILADFGPAVDKAGKIIKKIGKGQ